MGWFSKLLIRYRILPGAAELYEARKAIEFLQGQLEAAVNDLRSRDSATVDQLNRAGKLWQERENKLKEQLADARALLKVAREDAYKARQQPDGRTVLHV